MIQRDKCYSLQPSSDCQYIRQAGRTLPERFDEHRRDITNKLTDKSGCSRTFQSALIVLSQALLSFHWKPLDRDEKVYDEHESNSLLQQVKP